MFQQSHPPELSKTDPFQRHGSFGTSFMWVTSWCFAVLTDWQRPRCEIPERRSHFLFAHRLGLPLTVCPLSAHTSTLAPSRVCLPCLSFPRSSPRSLPPCVLTPVPFSLPTRAIFPTSRFPPLQLPRVLSCHAPPVAPCPRFSPPKCAQLFFSSFQTTELTVEQRKQRSNGAYAPKGAVRHPQGGLTEQS